MSPSSLGTHWFECDGPVRRHFTADCREDRDAFGLALGVALALNQTVSVRVALDGGGASAWRGIGWANPDGTIRWRGEGSPPLSSGIRWFTFPGEESLLHTLPSGGAG